MDPRNRVHCVHCVHRVQDIFRRDLNRVHDKYRVFRVQDILVKIKTRSPQFTEATPSFSL